MRRFDKYLLILALIWMLVGSVTCVRKVKADFPRPPAVMTDAINVPESEALAPESDDTTETPAELVDAGTEIKEEPKPQPVMKPKAMPRQIPKAEPESDVFPPDPPPKASRSEQPTVPSSIQGKVDKALALLTTVSTRLLTSVQHDQVNAARGFIEQAQGALLDGDDRRALVLADKGLILVDDVERESRQ